MKTGEEDAPAKTVTVGGTTAAGSELARLTTAPAAGAGPSRLTRLLVALTPAATVGGDRLTDDSAAGRTVRAAVLVTSAKVAEMVTTVLAATSLVVMVKTGDWVCPAATVTEAGTTAAGSELASVTTVLLWAGPFKVTRLEVAEDWPTREEGERVIDERAVGVNVSVAVLETPP